MHMSKKKRKKLQRHHEEHCLRLKNASCFYLFCFFSLLLCISSDQKPWIVKKLDLYAVVLPSAKRGPCNTRYASRITLDFVNATMPQCAQTDMKELCFPHSDTSNPHIMENRFPGAFRRLQRLTRVNVCPNYTISYSVESG